MPKQKAAVDTSGGDQLPEKCFGTKFHSYSPFIWEGDKMPLVQSTEKTWLVQPESGDCPWMHQLRSQRQSLKTLHKTLPWHCGTSPQTQISCQDLQGLISSGAYLSSKFTQTTDFGAPYTSPLRSLYFFSCLELSPSLFLIFYVWTKVPFHRVVVSTSKSKPGFPC